MKRRVITAVLLAAIAVAAAWLLPPALGYLRIGTTFAAQQTCACLYVSGRPLDSCLGDLGKAAKLLDVRAETGRVRATALFGLFAGESRNEPPYGCSPVR